jgi:hypothetical protein
MDWKTHTPLKRVGKTRHMWTSIYIVKFLNRENSGQKFPYTHTTHMFTIPNGQDMM